MSGAPPARVSAARVRRRARRYFTTGQPVVLPKALARCERETPHASATAGKLSSPDELRSMTHKALSTIDMRRTVTKRAGCVLDRSSGAYAAVRYVRASDSWVRAASSALGFAARSSPIARHRLVV